MPTPVADTDRVAREALCGIAWRTHTDVTGDRFDELRELCTAAGDQSSLAIAMAALVMGQAFQGRIREGSRLASEAWAFTESIGDPTLTVGLSFPLTYPKGHSGEWSDMLRWSRRAIDLADGDPTKGSFTIGSPLAVALASRAMARYCLGRPDWRDDLRHSLTMARSADPLSYAAVVAYVYWPGIPRGAVAADNHAIHEIEGALWIAERSGDDMALVSPRRRGGLALVHRPTDAERDRGQALLAEASDVFVRHGHNVSESRLINMYLARERARRGDRDAAIGLMFAAAEQLVREGQTAVVGHSGHGRSGAAIVIATANIGIATVPWRNLLASKDISRWPSR